MVVVVVISFLVFTLRAHSFIRCCWFGFHFFFHTHITITRCFENHNRISLIWIHLPNTFYICIVYGTFNLQKHSIVICLFTIKLLQLIINDVHNIFAGMFYLLFWFWRNTQHTYGLHTLMNTKIFVFFARSSFIQSSVVSPVTFTYISTVCMAVNPTNKNPEFLLNEMCKVFQWRYESPLNERKLPLFTQNITFQLFYL